jgi:hypothetical protein
MTPFFLLRMHVLVSDPLRTKTIKRYGAPNNRFISVADAAEDFQKKRDQITNN